MKRAFSILFAVAAIEAAAADSILEVPPAAVISNLAATYGAVTNVSCMVRREAPAIGEVGSILSRVTFARGDRLRVETLAPEHALTVADGTNVWALAPGEKKPSRTPISAFADVQLVFVRAVPATSETNLRVLDPATARDLPVEEPYARRVAFRTVFPDMADDPEAPEAIVSFDDRGRVARFDMPGGGVVLYFENPVEPLPGAWFYGRIVSTMGGDRTKPQLVSTFERLRVNENLPADTFDAGKAFP